jgi:hypothetical protein
LAPPTFGVFLEEAGVGIVGAGFLHLSDDVARVEMIEDAHEFAEIDVRNALVAAHHQHVLVVAGLRWTAEVRRAGDDAGIIAQAARIRRRQSGLRQQAQSPFGLPLRIW